MLLHTSAVYSVFGWLRRTDEAEPLWPSAPSCAVTPLSQEPSRVKEMQGGGLHGSDLFVRWTEIWGVWKLTDRLGLINMLLTNSWSVFFGWFIQPPEPTAIMEYQGVHSLQLGRWNVSKERCTWIPGPKGFPAVHVAQSVTIPPPDKRCMLTRTSTWC